MSLRKAIFFAFVLLFFIAGVSWSFFDLVDETVREATFTTNSINKPLLKVDVNKPLSKINVNKQIEKSSSKSLLKLDEKIIDQLPVAESINFFPLTEEGQTGFAIYDDDEANFLTTFEQLGFYQIGAPISRRFKRNGFTMQAFQKGIMQSKSADSGVGLLNLFDELSEQGLDPALYDLHQVPHHLPPDWDGDISSDEIVNKRLALLDGYPKLSEAYFAVKDPLAIYGLPASEVEDMGNHFALRFQRTILQEWKEDVPWAKAGMVTIANTGEIARSLNNLPAESLVPEPKSNYRVLVIPAKDIQLPLPDNDNDNETTTWSLPMADDIVQMRQMILNTFKANELEFDIGYPVQGFSPDLIYRRLFIRDTSTLMTGASYFYPAERLRWGVESFLHRQYSISTASTEDGWVPGFGAIPATVGFDSVIDKASTVSDEETHLIHAAYVTFEIIDNPYWLQEKIAGRFNWDDRNSHLSVITHLNAAGSWLLNNRYDKTTGLIVRDHTTDWGDVRFQPSTGNPTDIHPHNVVWNASIYDQALAYRAWRELAIMNRAVGDEERAKEWDAEAEALQQATNTHLWQAERGFYRTHLHITPLEHDFDEDEILSIANAVAIVCGLTNEEQNEQILTALEKARLEAGAPKPGVVLYPPYPTDFYTLPQMRLESTYQNGGVWDWWGAWQVLSAFEKGKAHLGRSYLLQTAADWMTHPDNVFEWQTVRTLEGAGGDQYTGAAGIYAQVIIEGLYGVHLTPQDPYLAPRLADWPGQITAHQPATKNYLRYTYQPLTNALILAYDTNHPDSSLPLHLLLPANFMPRYVHLDNNPLEWDIEIIGEDHYLTATLPTGHHQLIIEREVP